MACQPVLQLSHRIMMSSLSGSMQISQGRLAGGRAGWLSGVVSMLVRWQGAQLITLTVARLPQAPTTSRLPEGLIPTTLSMREKWDVSRALLASPERT